MYFAILYLMVLGWGISVVFIILAELGELFYWDSTYTFAIIACMGILISGLATIAGLTYNLIYGYHK